MINREYSSEFVTSSLYRPVIGTEAFLGQASFWANKIFGYEETSVVPVPSDVSTEDKQELGDLELEQYVGVGLPRADVFRPEEMKLVMLERQWPKELNFSSSYKYAVGRLIENAEKIAIPSRKDGEGSERYRTSGLYQSFDRIGIMHGVEDQNNVEIELDGVQVDVNLIDSGKRTEWSLTPNPAMDSTLMLVEQSKLCLRGLAEQSKQSRKIAYPASRMPLNIPFVRLPKDASERQLIEYKERICGFLPVKFVLGGIQD